MGKLTLLNVRHFINGADLTADTNKVEIDAKRENKDVTNYASNGWKEGLLGILQADVSVSGFYEAGFANLPDDACWGAWGGLNGVTTAPTGAADQALCYLTNADELEYSPIKGAVGDVAGIMAKHSTSWPLVRGAIALPPAAAISASGSGTANQLPLAGVVGAPLAANNYLYAALHVISVTGSPSLTMAIQSAAANTFASPTTRLTFAPATALGGQILRSAGPVTDTWWRANWTFSGSGSLLAVVSFGLN